MLSATEPAGQLSVHKTIKDEDGKHPPPVSVQALAELTPDLIRTLSENLLVYEYDRMFQMDFELKLEQLCRSSYGISLRKAALKALGIFGSKLVQARIASYLRDPHSIIRLTAARAFVCMFRRNIFPSTAHLEAIKVCAADELEPIRYESVDLIGALVCSKPNYTISVESGSCRLVNAMFIQICELCLDPSARIRARAARCLGTLPNLLEKRLIIQTFSKIPLHELTSGARLSARFKFHSHDMENVTSHREFVDICSSSSLPIIPDHTAGVFVHGLEDEYASVRHACLDSVYAFGLHDPLVAMIAFDFIVDMFHDELLSIRVSAVQAVHGLLRSYPSLNFNKVQLVSLLSNLSDCEPLVRRETLALLRVVSFRNAEHVQTTVLGLLRCLSLFAEDQEILFQTIRTIGTSHASLSKIVIENWYSQDPSVFHHQSVLTCGPSYLAFLLFVQSAGLDEDALPSSFVALLQHCCDRFPSRSDRRPDHQSQSWCCPSDVAVKAMETLDAWSKCKYYLAKTRAENLLACLRNNVSMSHQSNMDFCLLYAEWIWICCTVLAGEFISMNSLEQRANQIAFLLSHTFFGLPNRDRFHVNILHNFTAVSPSWWPDSLSLKRLVISMIAPICDPANPFEVRPQAATVVPIEADFVNAFERDKLAIRLQISSKCKLEEISSKDIFHDNVRWSFKVKSKIRITTHDLICDGKDAATSAQIGFVWCDYPDFWLVDPIKIYLSLSS